jgi:hypothetical protein
MRRALRPAGFTDVTLRHEGRRFFVEARRDGGMSQRGSHLALQPKMSRLLIEGSRGKPVSHPGRRASRDLHWLGLWG